MYNLFTVKLPEHFLTTALNTEKDEHSSSEWLYLQHGLSKPWFVLFKASLGPICTKRQRQRCNNACNSVLIENNGFAPEWGCNLFSSDSTDFNENRIASVIAAFTLTLGVNGPYTYRQRFRFVSSTF